MHCTSSFRIANSSFFSVQVTLKGAVPQTMLLISSSHHGMHPSLSKAPAPCLFSRHAGKLRDGVMLAARASMDPWTIMFPSPESLAIDQPGWAP